MSKKTPKRFFSFAQVSNVDIDKISIVSVWKNREITQEELDDDQYDYASEKYFEKYSIDYEYSPSKNAEFFLETDFLEIFDRLKEYRYVKGSHKPLQFTTVGPSDCKTIVILKKIIDHITDKIKQLYPNIQAAKIVPSFDPVYGDNDREKFRIFARDIVENRGKDNETQINLTPIYYHDSKKNGGKLNLIRRASSCDTVKTIIDKMPMFKHSKYGQYNEELSKTLYYEGKFIISFEVTIYGISKEGLKYKIKPVAKKIEMKCNVSKVESIFDSSTYNINITNKISQLEI